MPTVYYASEAALEGAISEGGAQTWAAIVFEPDGLGANGTYDYTLRFNESALSVPSTGSLLENFPRNRYEGLPGQWAGYFCSGFLSLQLALDDHILRLHKTAPPPPPGTFAAQPLPYAVPYPVEAFTHNTIFEHIGNLIGLVIVFSFIIPVSTMLRALVLEKESKLRENLLMMGARLPSYYGSLVGTYFASFLVISLCTAAEIGHSTFVRSSPLLVLLLFVLFGTATLAFTLALAPFFRRANVAAVVGALFFFVSSQLTPIFMDANGVVVDGMAGGKTLASLLPAMAFSIGANIICLYEGAEQGVDFSNARDGAFSFASALVMLAFDTILYSALAWYLDQVVPSKFGLQRPPYFLCRPSYWSGKGRGAADADADQISREMSIEPLEAAARRSHWRRTSPSVTLASSHIGYARCSARRRSRRWWASTCRCAAARSPPCWAPTVRGRRQRSRCSRGSSRRPPATPRSTAGGARPRCERSASPSASARSKTSSSSR